METKLDAIKNDWSAYKESKDLTNFALFYSKQIDWLIEQAEKTEMYEKALADIRNVSTLDEYEGVNPSLL
ncbi:MAG: hypothetical protein WD512_05130, partial [Candidatus Paceibacterota bacterium]